MEFKKQVDELVGAVTITIGIFVVVFGIGFSIWCVHKLGW